MKRFNLSRFKAALIDMDGVLYDSMPHHTLAWKRMMEEMGVKCTRDEFYLYEGMTGVATIDLLFRREFGHGCEAERAKALYDIKSRYFKEQGPAKRMPGADRMLAALKRGGLDRVLVTGSAQQSLFEGLAQDYPGMFAPSHRITALDVTKGKPDAEPYLKGAAKAGVAPTEAIVIENAPLGVRAGKAAGCFTIAVTTGPIPREKFEEEGADMIFPSMEAFADFLEFQVSVSEILKPLEADTIMAITDRNVFETGVRFDFADHILVLPPGEGSKSLDTAAAVWRHMSDKGLTRRSVVVNVGGGVITDLGGFCASVFKRGIRYVNIPTTLLAMADAAIGGKTGIDFKGLKNEIGTFAMPEDVLIWPKFLDTLPREEVLSGLAEVVKMALLTDKKIYDELIEGNPLDDKSLLERGVRHAAGCKREIVELDPREKGLRKILNLGHTAGHAYESIARETGRPISHGEAVAHGILTALELSQRLEDFPAEETERYRLKFLERYYAPLPFGREKHDEALRLMSHDKKNTGSGCISFVLLQAIGKPLESVAVAPDQVSTTTL